MPDYVEVLREDGETRFYKVLEEHKDHYVGHQVGGGFHIKIPKEHARPAQPRSNWQEVLTTCCESVPMKAWADLNYRWNGWLDPYFEKDLVMGYMQDTGWRVVKETDREVEFSHEDEYGDNVLVTAYDIEAAGKTLWNISGFCWELETEEEVCSTT